MTTIAWDGKTLAADRRSTTSNYPMTRTKLVVRNGVAVASAGSTAQCLEMAEWIYAGADPAALPARQLSDDPTHTLMVRDGKAYLFWDGPFPVLVEDPFTAVGSGRDHALTAMHLGKSAREAVEIAALFDNCTGNGVDVFDAFDPQLKHVERADRQNLL